MNTQVQGQVGYKKDSLMQQKTEAQKMYEQFNWIIKWETKWQEETQETQQTHNRIYLKHLQGYFLDRLSINVLNLVVVFVVSI